MTAVQLESLGPPAIKFAGFQLWVHSRQFPEATDYWDGNWLNVTVHCGASGSSVWATGAILDIVAIARWGTQLESLYRTLTGEAVLASDEPNLEVRVTSTDTSGHVLLRVEITPDHMTQEHMFGFATDQSYLPGVIGGCRTIVENYPIRDLARRGV